MVETFCSTGYLSFPYETLTEENYSCGKTLQKNLSGLPQTSAMTTTKNKKRKRERSSRAKKEIRDCDPCLCRMSKKNISFSNHFPAAAATTTRAKLSQILLNSAKNNKMVLVVICPGRSRGTCSNLPQTRNSCRETRTKTTTTTSTRKKNTTTTLSSSRKKKRTSGAPTLKVSFAPKKSAAEAKTAFLEKPYDAAAAAPAEKVELRSPQNAATSPLKLSRNEDYFRLTGFREGLDGILEKREETKVVTERHCTETNLVPQNNKAKTTTAKWCCCCWSPEATSDNCGKKPVPPKKTQQQEELIIELQEMSVTGRVQPTNLALGAPHHRRPPVPLPRKSKTIWFAKEETDVSNEDRESERETLREKQVQQKQQEQRQAPPRQKNLDLLYRQVIPKKDRPPVPKPRFLPSQTSTPVKTTGNSFCTLPTKTEKAKDNSNSHNNTTTNNNNNNNNSSSKSSKNIGRAWTIHRLKTDKTKTSDMRDSILKLKYPGLEFTETTRRGLTGQNVTTAAAVAASTTRTEIRCRAVSRDRR